MTATEPDPSGLAQAPDELLPASLPPRWTGHALRRGYAQAAHEAKKDMLETGRHGGWADGAKALAGYFNRASIWDEELNPLFGIGLQVKALAAGPQTGR